MIMLYLWIYFQKKVNFIINFIFLHFAYYIGIGITSIIAKIIGKIFLNIRNDQTSWHKINRKQSLKRMY